MASALSPILASQLVFRFLAGFFGSTPLTCAARSISDLWDPLEKTYDFPLFAIVGFGGPVLGPVMGSYIGVGSLSSWHWSEWIILVMSALSVFFGYGVISISISSYMYIVDCYKMYAVSALTFVTIVRHVAAGGMNVAGIPFYQSMGTHWTLTILGCLSTLMVHLFYRYGHAIRQRSKYMTTRL